MAELKIALKYLCHISVEVDMKFSVAYNGDLELIDQVAAYDTVKHLYGCAHFGTIGSGRSSFGVSDISKQEIEQAIKKSHEYGIEFNYLINASCMGNKEYAAEKRKEMTEMLGWLNDLGVEWVTIANPYIIDLCKSKYPNLKISLSSFTTVETVQRAKFFDSIGVQEITVRENITRDLRMLQQIKKAVDCEIQVLANQTCLFQCPYQLYHDNVMSHGSINDEESKEGFVDYCILQCTLNKFTNKEEIIKSRWIRPEDIDIYESYGIDTFKISDRGKSTAWIIRSLNAYHNKKYEGNLADILNIVHTKSKRLYKSDSVKDNKPQDITNMRQFVKSMEYLDIFIDNSKLDGFLDFFIKSDCRLKDCNICGYCKRVAGETVSVDVKLVERGLDGLKKVYNDIMK